MERKVTVEITVQDKNGTSTYQSEGCGHDCDNATGLLIAAISAASKRDSQPPYVPPPEMFATSCLREHGLRNLADVVSHLLWDKDIVNVYPDVLVRQGCSESIAKHLQDEIDRDGIQIEKDGDKIHLKSGQGYHIATIREKKEQDECKSDSVDS